MTQSQAQLVAQAEQEPGLLSLLIQRHRIRLSNYIVQQCHGKVLRGPFTGMILSAGTGGWGDADRASMALGLYEQEILKIIERTAPRGCTFVNLGSADGYYAIGMLHSGIASHAYCFEIDTQARERLLQLAIQNGVAEKITILGKAEVDFYKSIANLDSHNLFVLCDVEGAEFEIFSQQATFDALHKAHIVIEMHDWDESLRRKAQDLVSMATDTHRPSFFSTASRDLSDIELLKPLDDTNRWLVCSEGRPKMMEWCHLTPLK
jgi:hypothetical protein